MLKALVSEQVTVLKCVQLKQQAVCGVANVTDWLPVNVTMQTSQLSVGILGKTHRVNKAVCASVDRTEYIRFLIQYYGV